MANNPPIKNYGSIAYTNNQNNWRAEDVEFLQRRAIQRYPSISALAEHQQFGAVAYVADDSDSDDDVEPGPEAHFRLYANSNPGWQRIVTSENLRIPSTTDTNLSVHLRHRSASSSGGVSLKSDGSVAVSSKLEVGPQVVIESGTLKLTASGSTRTLQVASGKLTVDGTLRADTLESAGAVTSTSVTTTARVTAGNGLTVSAGGISVTGSSTLGNTSVSSLTSTSSISASSHVAVGNVRLGSTGVTYSTGSSVRMDVESNSIAFTTPSLTFRNTSSQLPVNVAGAVVSSSQPSGNYPDGTLWIQI